jgi:hypothetical protein
LAGLEGVADVLLVLLLQLVDLLGGGSLGVMAARGNSAHSGQREETCQDEAWLHGNDRERFTLMNSQ